MPPATGSLKKAYSYQRDDIIEKEGWTTMPGSTQPVEGAADVRAKRILKASLSAKNG